MKTVAVLTLAVLIRAAQANAGGLIFQFDNTYTGTSPTGSGPWVTATFQDEPNGVLLTVNNSGLTGGEFLGSLYLNVNPSDSTLLQNLTFTEQSASAGVALPTIQAGNNAFKAGGDGKFDIVFNFATANAGRLGAGEQITYLISGISGLTANDFDFNSTPASGNPPFVGAIHVQGIGNGNSGWVDPSLGAIVVPVPEPGTNALLLLAASLIGGRYWWLRRARA